jgi:hypothetical protein
MNTYFVLAGGLAIIVTLVHSVLGEVLLISRLTADGLPALGGSKEFARRTLRFSWHLCTAFGLGLAAILLRLAWPSSESTDLAFGKTAIALSCLAASLIALIISRGKHPGWIALFGVAILTWLGCM